MFLVYADDFYEEVAESLKAYGLKYRFIGHVLLVNCGEEELIDVLSSLSDRVIKSIKIIGVSPEELKKPEDLLNIGFKALPLENYIENKMFFELSKMLGGVETYFQAIVDRQKKLYGFEALCRSEVPIWKLFKMSDRVAFLTDYYCREKALLEFKSRFYGKYHLFLNFHPKFLKDPLENVGELEANLKMKGLDPRFFVVEIDEYEGMDLKALRMIRDFLKSAGIKVALDDVGAGYAGLYQLVEIHPDIAKLDMELVRNVYQNKLKQVVIKGIVQACKEAGILVLAEGVEKKEELDFLQDLGVDLYQGFLFAKPEPYPRIKEIESRAYNLLS